MKPSTTLALCAALAVTALVGCGDDSKSGTSKTAAYCARIASYKVKSDELDAVFAGTPDSAKVKDAFTMMQSMVHDLGSDAPAEIKADVTSMTTAIDSVVEIFSKYDWDFLKLASAPEFATLQETLTGADMQGASDRLKAYSENTCGIVDDTTVASESTAP